MCTDMSVAHVHFKLKILLLMVTFKQITTSLLRRSTVIKNFDKITFFTSAHIRLQYFLFSVNHKVAKKHN